MVILRTKTVTPGIGAIVGREAKEAPDGSHISLKYQLGIKRPGQIVRCVCLGFTRNIQTGK